MEQIIIFVYDTGFCQTEADDPQKAVLFFHPNWVSDQQRLALCGQLMGAAHFCSSMFSTPSVLALQSGKFVLKKFGQYILSVGSDQSLPEWILNERFNTLQFLLQFYHKDFESILLSVDSDHELFIKKLAQILEMYIPVLQFVVSSYGNVPTIRFPKTSSNIFLEAFHLLESCCNAEGVLGGVVLYHSRVLATQFDSDTTKMLTLTDPFRIKSCAESIPTPFHLPVGVQVLRVFVTQKTYDNICNAVNIKTVVNEERRTTDVVREGKREVAKIFTVHEEEDWSEGFRKESQRASDVVSSARRTRSRRQSRPKVENNALKERSKNFKSNHNLSICSTPTVEKTLIHEELVSICSGKLEQKHGGPVEQNFIPDLVQDAIKAKTKYSNKRLHRISMDDLMVDLSHKAFPVPMRYYSFGLPKLCKEQEKTDKRKLYKNRFYKTIADPMNPVFRYDGVPVSKSLYNHCLDEHYKDYIAANITIDSREELIKSRNQENEKKTEKKEKPVEKRELSSANQKLFRRSLTLPLKPMTFDGLEASQTAQVVKNKVLHSITPSTPLMSKLSLLSLEEQHSELNKPQPPPAEPMRKKKISTKTQTARKKKENSDTEESRKSESDSGTVRCALFVCGQQNMTVLLLMEEAAEQSPNLILSLWESSTAQLDKLQHSRHATDHLSSKTDNSSYSFLSLDPQWGTLQRAGPWGHEELRIVGSLHQDLVRTHNITEVVTRNEDAVVYGYRCGSTETFYQQGGCSSVGLPTPADLMGVVSLKARRRLERDHGLVLL